MKKIKLISDSTCDLSKEFIKLHQIEIAPLNVSFEDEQFRDGVDITTNILFEKVDKSGITPKTSAVSPGTFEEIFRKYLEQDYIVLYVGIGSGFSATHQSALLAKSLIGDENIYLVDSMNLSTGIGLLVMKAAKLIKENYKINEILDALSTTIPKVRSQFVIDTLDYLHKGGRLSALGALMGKVLKIHPVIKVEDGKMVVGKKAFGSMKKGVNLMLKEPFLKKDSIDKEYFTITHAMAPTFEYTSKKVKENLKIENLIETEAGCVISTHCGKGAIGVVYIVK